MADRNGGGVFVQVIGRHLFWFILWDVDVWEFGLHAGEETGRRGRTAECACEFIGETVGDVLIVHGRRIDFGGIRNVGARAFGWCWWSLGWSWFDGRCRACAFGWFRRTRGRSEE